MANVLRIPKSPRKFKRPADHKELKTDLFENGFSVSPERYLYFFGKPVGSSELNLTSFQKIALFGTMLGALGSAGAAWLGLKQNPSVNIPQIPVEVRVNTPAPEFNIVIDEEIIPQWLQIKQFNEDTGLRIQLKCAPIIEEGLNPPRYMCSQQITE